jgi:hypothetical protein
VPQTQMNIYNQPQQWQYMQPMPMYVPYTSSYTSSPQALSPSSPVYYVSPPYVPTEQQFGSIYQPQQHHSLRSNHPMSVEVSLVLFSNRLIINYLLLLISRISKK